MKKTVKVNEDTKITIDTALSWIYIYKNQFGTDAMLLFTNFIRRALPLLDDLLVADGNIKKVDKSLLTYDFYDKLVDVIESTDISDILNILWSLCKNADDTVAEPEKFFKSLGDIATDEVVKEVVPAVVQSCLSKKKYLKVSEFCAKLKSRPLAK